MTIKISDLSHLSVNNLDEYSFSPDSKTILKELKCEIFDGFNEAYISSSMPNGSCSGNGSCTGNNASCHGG